MTRLRAVPRRPAADTGEGRTKQQFKDECDINNIMKRYQKTGLIAHVNRYQGNYGDFTGAPDYLESMMKITKANEMFMTLPADVRDRFANDPGQFLKFVGDEANAEEIVKLGLAKRREAPVETIQKVEVINPQTDAK